MSSLMFSPASCVSVLMAVGLLKMSMAVLLVTRPFWVTSSAARSSRSPLPSSASHGLHIGLVQPPDFCVGEGLPGVELLLELYGQLVALGAGVACKPFLDGCLHHVVAHRLELRTGCAVRRIHSAPR